MSDRGREEMHDVRVRWDRGLVLLCTDCDKRVAKRLRKDLKERLAPQIRVVLASCLDVCPKRGVAGCVVDRTGGIGATPVVIAADADRAALAAEIVRRCGGGAAGGGEADGLGVKLSQ